MKLNLGSGEDDTAGIDLDIRRDCSPEIQGTTTDLPFESETFRVVEADQLMEHLTYEETVQTLEEVYRVLKDDGVFRMMVPHGDSRLYKQDPTHHTRWTYRTMQYFFGGNFSYYTSDAFYDFDVAECDIDVWYLPEFPLSGVRTLIVRFIHQTWGVEDEYLFGGKKDGAMRITLEKVT